MGSRSSLSRRQCTLLQRICLSGWGEEGRWWGSPRTYAAQVGKCLVWLQTPILREQMPLLVVYTIQSRTRRLVLVAWRRAVCSPVAVTPHTMPIYDYPLHLPVLRSHKPCLMKCEPNIKKLSLYDGYHT